MMSPPSSARLKRRTEFPRRKPPKLGLPIGVIQPTIFCTSSSVKSGNKMTSTPSLLSAIMASSGMAWHDSPAPPQRDNYTHHYQGQSDTPDHRGRSPCDPPRLIPVIVVVHPVHHSRSPCACRQIA